MEDPREAMYLTRGEGDIQFSGKENVIRFDQLSIPVLLWIQHTPGPSVELKKKLEKLCDLEDVLPANEEDLEARKKTDLLQATICF